MRQMTIKIATVYFIMASIQLRKSGNGNWFRKFYGKYTDKNGTSRTKVLSTRMEGTPPAGGSMKDCGDYKFEQSRKKAQKEIDGFEELARENRAEVKDVKRLLEVRHGKFIETKISDLQSIMEQSTAFSMLNVETQKRKRRAVIDFMDWCKSQRLCLISEISRTVARQYLAYLLKKDENGKTFATKSVSNRILAVSSILDIPNVLLEYMPNPFHKIKIDKPLNEKIVSRRPLSDDEVELLLGVAARKQIAYDLIVGGLYTGQRISDVFNLKWEDVDSEDVERMSLKIQQKKTGVVVRLPIAGRFKDVVVRKLEQKTTGDVYVFTEAVLHRRGTFKKIYQIFEKAFGETTRQHGTRKKKNSILGFHSLRGTFIKQRLLDGWTIPQVSTFSGHKSAENIYKHYYKAEGVEFRDKFEANIAKREGKLANATDSPAMLEIKKQLPLLTPFEKETLKHFVSRVFVEAKYVKHKDDLNTPVYVADPTF